MGRSLGTALGFFGLLLSFACPALAQTPASPSLAGIVQDEQGGVIPGASVTVVALSDGRVAATTSTNQSGTWEVASLDPGTYRVSVSLSGFKTVRHDAVVVTGDRSVSITTTLKIASMVSDGYDPHPSLTESYSTASNDLTDHLPLFRRNAMYVMALLPGINTNPRYAIRDATMFGLPPTMTGLYLDGISIKPPGAGLVAANSFATVIRPSPDIVDESSAGPVLPGGDASSRLPTSISFLARRGSNPSGSVYAYSRPANDSLLNDFGVRSGGPVVLPHLFDGRGRVFYHLSYEEERLSAPDGRTGEHLFAGRVDANFSNRLRATASVAWQGDRARLGDVEQSTEAFVARTRLSATLTGNIVNEATVGTGWAERPGSNASLIEASDVLTWLKGAHTLAVGVQSSVNQLGEAAGGATVSIQDQWRPRFDLTVDAGVRHAAPHLDLHWKPHPEWDWLLALLGDPYMATLLAGCARLDSPDGGHSCSVGFQRSAGRTAAIYVRFLDVEAPVQSYQLTEIAYEYHWAGSRVAVSYSHQNARENAGIPANALKGFVVWQFPRGWNASLVSRIESVALLDMSVRKSFSLGPRQKIEFGLEVFNLTNSRTAARVDGGQSVMAFLDPSDQFDHHGRVGQFVVRVLW